MMKTITTQQLKSMQKENQGNFFLINTLPKDKFSQTKLPGAVNIPQDAADFAKQVESTVGEKGAAIVVYCGSEECNSSSQGAEKLEQAGFSNVSVYKAGAKGWQQDPAEQQQQSAGRR